MLAPSRPANEATRLAALRALGILDSAPDERFDALTRIAARVFDTPIALVTLVDEERQWFKSHPGLLIGQTPRDVSFCAHAIEGDAVFVVEDTLLDPRFADNLLVLGPPGIRFYAGCPMAGPDGSLLGTLCVIDTRPRGFSEEDRALLRDLTRLVELELRSIALALERDATEAALRGNEARLREQEERLRDAGRQKDEFLATLAHELRNPLAPILAAAHVIRLREPADAMIVQARDTIERQTNHLARLVDDLLDVARITQGRMVLRRRPESVLSLVADAIDAVRPAIEAASHTLSVSLPHEPLQVDADATRVAQALLNLLHNAAKYTPDGGRIDVGVRRAGHHVEISVRDSGIGISAGDIEHIFGLFAQDRGGAARRQGGLGIGLALARKLVEMHGGSIAATSPGLGHGARFVITLPLLQAAPASSASSRAVAAARAPCRILLVDDNADSLEMMLLMLELQGHTVRTAATGREALAEAERERPDVILLDIGLPDLDGYQVARELHVRFGAACPVLAAITGWGQPSDRQHAFDAGFTRHFTKPVDPRELEGFISDTVKVRQSGATPRER